MKISKETIIPENVRINAEEAKVILDVRGGADIYDYSLAKIFRTMERRGVIGYFDITRPMMYTGDGTDKMPYFGVISTKAGIKAAKKVLKI